MSSQLAQGASLIGKTVTYQPAGGTTPISGVVESLTVGRRAVDEPRRGRCRGGPVAGHGVGA